MDPRALRGVALALLATGCLATAACGDDDESTAAGAPGSASAASAASATAVSGEDSTSSLPADPPDVLTDGAATDATATDTLDATTAPTTAPTTATAAATGPRLEGNWRLVFRAVTVKGRYRVIKPGSEAAWRYSFVATCETGPCDAVATLNVDGEPPRTVRYRYTGSSWVSRTKYSWGSMRCQGKVVQDAIAATQQVTLTFNGDDLVGTFSNNDNARPALAEDGCAWQGRIRGAVIGDRR